MKNSKDEAKDEMQAAKDAVSVSGDEKHYPGVYSNDTELDIAVGKEAEKQKRETGKSEDSAVIKARLAGANKGKVHKNLSIEEDMRAGHEDSKLAQRQDAENRVEKVEAEAKEAREALK